MGTYSSGEDHRYDWDRSPDPSEEHHDPPLPHAEDFTEAIRARSARERRIERARRACLVAFALFVLAIVVTAVFTYRSLTG